MELFTKDYQNLATFCSGIWTTPGRCEVVLNDAGLEPSKFNLIGQPLIVWWAILNELRIRNDGSMSRLVVALMHEYPENNALRAASAPWVPSPAQAGPVGIPGPAPFPGAGPPGQKTEPPLGALETVVNPAATTVPLIAPIDYSDEADLVAQRGIALWHVMADLVRRVEELEKTRGVLRPLVVQPPQP